MERLIISFYFALTVLVTVGYGDYYPLSNIEIVSVSIFMIFGVVFFSYIMGSFIDIIANYQKKMSLVNKSPLLRNWLVLLTRFTGGKPLTKNLQTQIENHFHFY